MIVFRKTCAALMVMTLVVATGALAADVVDVPTRVQSVALFKNGLGYFTRVGELPAAPAEIELGPMPAAVHGTFWLGWEEGVAFDDLRSREVDASEMRAALSVPELLRANVGKRARLYLAGEDRPLTGRIAAVPEPPRPQPPNPYLSVIMPPQPPANNLVLVESDRETLGIPMGNIVRVAFLEPAATEVPVDTRHVALAGQLTAGQAGQALAASYLVQGMTWAPSYRVDITNPEQARLTAKAAILNEIEDLEDTRVDLVTGFPYVEFSGIISPLAKKTDLQGFLNALYRGAGPRGPAGPAGPAGVMAQTARLEYLLSDVPDVDYGAPVEGVEAEDLFFYPVEGVTLARGETGYYPLFTADIPYKHVYTWDIPDYIGDSDHYQDPTQERQQIVWHSLRLTNTMGMPWTTAPAETVQDGRLLGQATLHYAPRGAETLLKITQALGIEADEVELEINRQADARTFRGSRYDLVTVQGTLKLRSHLDKPVAMEITKLVTGEVQESSPTAQVEKLAAGLQGVNSRSRLTWKLDLPAGAEQEITYSFTVYVR